MLYEVITLLENVNFQNWTLTLRYFTYRSFQQVYYLYMGFLQIPLHLEWIYQATLHVITSYSIHYTKLYEERQA